MTAKNTLESWLICHNLKEWHDWLATHYDIETGVWLQIKKTRSNELGVGMKEAVEEGLCFGWIDSKILIAKVVKQ